MGIPAGDMIVRVVGLVVKTNGANFRDSYGLEGQFLFRETILTCYKNKTKTKFHLNFIDLIFLICSIVVRKLVNLLMSIACSIHRGTGYTLAADVCI